MLAKILPLSQLTFCIVVLPSLWRMKIIKATEKGSWKPLWFNLFNPLKQIVPKPFRVIVCADRGLYADWLYQLIVSMGWHPCLRINQIGTYRPVGSEQWLSLKQVVNQPGQHWSGLVTCFKTNPLDCTLLARWDRGYQYP